MRKEWRKGLATGLFLISMLTAGAQQIIYRTKDSSKGTILFFAGAGLKSAAMKPAQRSAQFFAKNGFDVVMAAFPVRKDKNDHDLEIKEGISTFRQLKQKKVQPELKSNRLLIFGVGKGGHIAAEVTRRLGTGEQPSELVLVDPIAMDESVPGTVLPAVRPPLQPAAKLILVLDSPDSAITKPSVIYAKTWHGYDGETTLLQMSDTGTGNHRAADQAILDALEAAKTKTANEANPAEIPTAGYAGERHQEKADSIAAHQYDLLMIGNSITNNFDKPEYQPVWKQFFGSRNAINLGYSGYRTENLLWNLDNGELAGQKPKVAVIEIGTNNVDEKHYPTRHTAGQLAGGITAIINRIRKSSPGTKIIVLRCFPGSYDGALPTSHRAILERASDIVSRTADNEHVFYCDVNQVFLNLDGSVNHNLMPDYLHPSEEGARLWAQAMEPLLSKLMGDSSRDTDLPANTAIIPASKLEEDGYNWWDRHAEVLKIKDSLDPEVVLIGNSITHFWGGLPLVRDLQGNPRATNGPLTYPKVFGKYRVLNLGFGWDRTQNVLWRLDHGELDGLHPRLVVIDIGTNNTSQTQNARMNTAPEIVEGIDAVIRRVRSKVPAAHIVVMAVFPREKDPKDPRRLLIVEINKMLKKYTEENALTLVDIGPDMLQADGFFIPGMMRDYTHPDEKGYEVWGRHLGKFLAEP